VSREAPPDVAAELRAIYSLVEDLPANVRVPLVLRRVEGYALEEIARLTGASLATVKRRVADGERQLEVALEAADLPRSPGSSR
jgi:RNA polymerase sigma-70 factor (ECF subfamily)